MKCKKGDMALIIKGYDTGKMVTCQSLLGSETNPLIAPNLGPVWLIDRQIGWVSVNGGIIQLPWCPDSQLMPITPDDESIFKENDKELCDALDAMV